jgi:hypothetical protein
MSFRRINQRFLNFKMQPFQAAESVIHVFGGWLFRVMAA